MVGARVMKRKCVLAKMCLLIRGANRVSPAAAPGAGGAVTVLASDGRMWRYFEVWRTDAARTAAGQVVRVDGTR